jgi:SAM-dependent methyltransferase
MTDDDTSLTAQVTAAYTALGPQWDTAGSAWNQPAAEGLVARAGLAPGMTVLDAGCGAGAATIPAAAAVSPGGHVTGIDLAEPMLARAARHATDAGLAHVDFQHADAADPPFAAGSFDAVLASMVMYLLPDPAAALCRWRELLRPGGILAFSWVTTEDPGWEPAYAAVDAFLPDEHEGWSTFWRRPPWDSIASAEALLTGYADIATTAEPVPTVYASPRQWWQSSWTQAPALIWQHIPPARRDTARDAAFALLEDLRGRDGTLTRVRMAGYTTARRPPDHSDQE